MSWNVFRIAGDMLHATSFILLLLKILATRNVRGLSLKAAILHCMVFYCRYFDIFWNTTALYNTLMKAFFLTCSTAIMYLIGWKKPYCESYNKEQDSLNVWFLIGPCTVLSLIFHSRFTLFELLWTFSEFLEMVAIVPQVYMTHFWAQENSGSVENLTKHYMGTLGLYRLCYIFNWIYRGMVDNHYWDPISWVSGVVQTLIYADFLYYYIKAVVEKKNMSLPV